MATVTGAGSLWSNAFDLYVGINGSGSQLLASNGGTVQAANGYLGSFAGSLNNRLTVDGGALLVTNPFGPAVLDIRRGTNVLNAGQITADNLLLTNNTGVLELNGGTLVTLTAKLGNGLTTTVGSGVVWNNSNGLLVDSGTALTLAGNGSLNAGIVSNLGTFTYSGGTFGGGGGGGVPTILVRIHLPRITGEVRSG